MSKLRSGERELLPVRASAKIGEVATALSWIPFCYLTSVPGASLDLMPSEAVFEESQEPVASRSPSYFFFLHKVDFHIPHTYWVSLLDTYVLFIISMR